MRFVSVTVDHYVATVCLDRPPVNAITPAVSREIRESFESFRDEKAVRVAIFTAAGSRAFMAGADLKEVDDSPERAVSEVLDRGLLIREGFWSIYDCAVPVICAVNGPAIGAGLAYAAVCDIIIAAENATFSTAEIDVGLLGASSLLALLVPRHKVRELFFTAEAITPHELRAFGAVRAVVPGPALMAAARELANSLAKKSPLALRLAKESANRVEFMALKDAYRTEQDYTNRLLAFDDSREARRAFLEKRDPVWMWR